MINGYKPVRTETVSDKDQQQQKEVLFPLRGNCFSQFFFSHCRKTPEFYQFFFNFFFQKRFDFIAFQSTSGSR
jgi:hypothetical protein